MSKVLNASLVLRLRERGLVLTEGGSYSSPRLASLVLEQRLLMNRFDELDKELESLAKQEEEPCKSTGR